MIATPARPLCPGPTFEINLLGDQVRRLRRHQTLRQVGVLCALAMLLVGAGFAVRTATHLTKARRLSLGVRELSRSIEGQRKICQELDTLRATVQEQCRPFLPLLPIARARTAWTPKLLALAEALPPEAGLLLLNASSGDPFAAPTVASVVTANAPDTSAHLSLAVLYRPSSAGLERPITLLERLRASPAFMEKMDTVRLEAMEADHWQGRPAVVVRGTAKGVSGL